MAPPAPISSTPPHSGDESHTGHQMSDDIAHYKNGSSDSIHSQAASPVAHTSSAQSTPARSMATGWIQPRMPPALPTEERLIGFESFQGWTTNVSVSLMQFSLLAFTDGT